jgi:hypothetical protein
VKRFRIVAIILGALLVGSLSPAEALDRASDPVYDGLIPDGGCGPGLYAVAAAPGICTHGPDLPPDDTSTDPPSAASQEGAPSGASAAATVACEGDGVSGHRIQLMYLRSSDVPDRYEQFKAAFQQRAEEVDQLLDHSAAQTGGSRHFRFVHDASCAPEVATLVMEPPGDDDYGTTVDELLRAGHTRTDRSYLLFVDAAVYCGIASSRVDDQPGPANRNNSGPSYARVDTLCWGNAPAIAHELMHNLGGVQGTAPNGTRGFHCTDEWDVMCYSDPPDFPQVEIVCPDETYDVTIFDCNNDDYFHTNPPAGNYLDTHWNTADSRFLIVGAPTVVVPSAGARGSALSADVGPNPIVTPGKSYRLMWADAASGLTCDHPDARKIAGPTIAAADGSIATTTGQVPRLAARGVASVCFAKTSNPSADNSEPATFRVL